MTSSEPDSAIPEFDGQCAFALSTGKLGVAGSPKHSVESDGHTYLFSNGAARFLWRVLPNRLDKATAAWSGRSP